MSLSPVPIRIPGSKSISNRAIILAFLSGQKVFLKKPLFCEDTELLAKTLTNFGAKFERNAEDLVVISPEKRNGNSSENFIGNGGTPARFLVALSSVLPGKFSLSGVERMHSRPFAELFSAVKNLGVEIEFLGNKNFLPAKFSNNFFEQKKFFEHKSSSKKIEISGQVSSQFISALLLAAPEMGGEIQIQIKGDVPSRPYFEMTLQLLSAFGVRFSITNDRKCITIQSKIKAPKAFEIAGDLSAASYPLAFSMLRKVPICIENFGERGKTFQGDEKFLEVLEKMGAQIEREKAHLTIFPPAKIRAVPEMDFSAMPDVSMTGMILAALGDGVSEFCGLESLRVKECDRIAAMHLGLAKLGIKSEISGDRVKIFGDPNHSFPAEKIKINSFSDHRIAMVFGVLQSVFGLKMQISDPECVAKSWPEFWENLADWNRNLREVSAIILQNPSEKKYLIVRKPRSENSWQFPQGGVEKGESGAAAAARELAEECGENLKIKLQNQSPVGHYRYLFPANFTARNPEHLGAKVSFFAADFLGGKVQIDQNEIVDFKWATVDEMPDFFEPKYWQVVKKFLEK